MEAVERRKRQVDGKAELLEGLVTRRTRGAQVLGRFFEQSRQFA
jgi:hypothetical protein